MEYIVLIIAVFGCVYCPFWIKNANDNKDRGYGIFSMCGSIIMLVISIFLISYK